MYEDKTAESLICANKKGWYLVQVDVFGQGIAVGMGV